MKMKIYFIALALVAQNATAMENPELPDFPAPPRPYTIAQLVNELRSKGKIQEIMFSEPKNSELSVINLDDRGLTDLTGLSLLLPDNPKKSVWRISARNNHITTIPADDLAHYKDLETLQLDNNRITDLGDTSNPISFAKICPNCAWLTLSNNHIPNIYAASFAGLRNLEYLSLKNNRIRAIENGAFRALLKLEILYCDTNNLCSFPDRLVQGLRQLEKLTLFGNHLTCKSNIVLPSRTELEFDPQKPHPLLWFLEPEQAQKITGLINSINDTENPLTLRESIRTCTNLEQKLIFEIAPDCVRVKLVVILTELRILEKRVPNIEPGI